MAYNYTEKGVKFKSWKSGVKLMNKSGSDGLLGLRTKQLNLIISIFAHALTIISCAIILTVIASWFAWVRHNDQQVDKLLDHEIAYRNER